VRSQASTRLQSAWRSRSRAARMAVRRRSLGDRWSQTAAPVSPGPRYGTRAITGSAGAGTGGVRVGRAVADIGSLLRAAASRSEGRYGRGSIRRPPADADALVHRPGVARGGRVLSTPRAASLHIHAVDPDALTSAIRNGEAARCNGGADITRGAKVNIAPFRCVRCPLQTVVLFGAYGGSTTIGTKSRDKPLSYGSA